MSRRLRCMRIRSEEHTSELQSLRHLVCRLLLEKKFDRMCRGALRWGVPVSRVGQAQSCAPVARPHASTPLFKVGTSPTLPMVYQPLFLNDPATTEIYALSLHDALPI